MRKKVIAFILVQALLLTILFNFLPVPALAQSTFKRIAGNDRYETSVAISKAGWKSADAIVIASGEDFPDGLAGGPLAYKLNAPLLLTKKDGLPDVVSKEIDRLNPTKAYILGGPNAVSGKVEQALENKGLLVERVYGNDRAETAAEIAKRVGAPSGKAIIATGLNFPDALAVSPVAAANNLPILFVYGNRIPKATLDAISELGIKQVDVIGGPNVVPDSAVDALQSMGIGVNRIYGDNREMTALEIAIAYSGIEKGIFLATGYNFADALSVAPLAAKLGRPLLLCEKSSVYKNVARYIRGKKLAADGITVIGGENAVSSAAVAKLFNNNSGVIEIYELTIKKTDKNSDINILDFVVDYIPGASSYRFYMRYAPYDYTWYAWSESSFWVGDDGCAYFKIYCSEKGMFWVEIQAVNKQGKVIARSQPFSLVLNGRDPNGRLIVYTDQQLVYAVSQGIDLVISDTAPQIQEYYSKAKSIISKIIKPGMTDYQKEKAIHDYIVNNTRYDTRSYVPEESYTPYGVLINGVAVCQGYAYATALLLNMAGVKSIVVVGTAGGGPHAWNIVQINGQYYHLDTTWDDPVVLTGNNTIKNVLRYNYFNLSDSEIAKDHYWERNNYPACPKPGPRP